MEIQGVLHAHSHYSYDAKLSLAELRDFFVDAGLHFVCMTEHTDELTPERAREFVTECDRFSDETFRFIPGFEVPYRHAHILMVGMRDFLGVYAPTLEVLKKWTSQTPFVVLAHPVRNHFEVEDGLLDQLDAIEVWNQQYEGKRVPRARSLRLFETLKKKKPRLCAIGGVDFHRKEHMGAPIIALTVDTFDESSIFEKLRTGAFTVSSPRARIYGTLPDAEGKIQVYGFESHISVAIIALGKFVNKVLASLGISLPRSWKQLVRRRL